MPGQLGRKRGLVTGGQFKLRAIGMLAGDGAPSGGRYLVAIAGAEQQSTRFNAAMRYFVKTFEHCSSYLFEEACAILNAETRPLPSAGCWTNR
jgi:hypothetical protein